MEHRHLDNAGYSKAAIDDMISNGDLGDWVALRDKAQEDAQVMRDVYDVALHNSRHPEFPEYPPQRYIAWLNWTATQLDLPKLSDSEKVWHKKKGQTP